MILLSTVRRAPAAVVDVADDLQDLAFIGFFQLAARFDGPATLLFDTIERVEAAAFGVVGAGHRLLQTNRASGNGLADVAER
jgi:hypothetical protein